MKKIFCDICEKEIGGKEDWSLSLDSFECPNIVMDDVCKECAITIYQCINMMKECGWKPDFHESLNSESIWTRDVAGHVLYEIKEEINEARANKEFMKTFDK